MGFLRGFEIADVVTLPVDFDLRPPAPVALVPHHAAVTASAVLW